MDLHSGQLRKHGIKLRLQELPFRLLAALLERAGEVVSREELQARLWPAGTYVDFERGLGTALNKVREALGDSAVAPRFIETIPRRGYRFLAEVEKNGRPPLEVIAPSSRGWRKYAIAATISAMFAAGAVLFWFHRQPHPLSDKDVLVLADFINSTGDPVFDATLRDALAYQLEQSPFLKVLDEEAVRQDLQLMRRSPEEHFTNQLAHDVCVREGQKAMIGGSIARLGSTYVIEVKATTCRTGSTLARDQAEAADKDHVLPALAQAAQRMRAKLGESLSSIQTLAPPDWRVTTSSIEAFRAFSEGQALFTQSQYVEAIPALRRATELDPNLAFAWSWLASAVLNTGGGGNRELSKEYLNKALALRDRVSAYERFWLDASWYGSLGQRDRAFELMQVWARTYPRDPAPLVGIASGYTSRGDLERGLRAILQAYDLAPRRRFYAAMVMDGYIKLDRFAEAKATGQGHFSRGFDDWQVHQRLLQIAWIEGDRDSAAHEIQWFAGQPEEYLGLEYQASYARMRGQMRPSAELLERAADLARRRNLPDVAARLRAPHADEDALLGNCSAARKESVASPLRLALCQGSGMVRQAENNAQETAERGADGDSLWTGARFPLIRASIEYGRGSPAEAVDLLEPVRRYERAFPFAIYLRGLAYLRLRRGTEAAAEFQKVLDHPGANWGPLYPLSYVGLARASTMVGDTGRARKAYEGFLAFWKDADPDLILLTRVREEYAALH